VDDDDIVRADHLGEEDAYHLGKRLAGNELGAMVIVGDAASQEYGLEYFCSLWRMPLVARVTGTYARNVTRIHIEIDLWTDCRFRGCDLFRLAMRAPAHTTTATAFHRNCRT
jgi:hypothetical protein